MGRVLQLVVAVSVGAVAAAACGGQRAPDLDVAYNGECVIEMEFERGTKQSAVDAFTLRVERISHVERTQILSRSGNIARFSAALRMAGHTGQEYERLMARAQRYAGRVLLVKADDDRNVFAIIHTLGGLPAVVTSVAERDSCHRSS